MKAYFLRLVHYVIALAEFLQYLVLRMPLYGLLASIKSKTTASTINEDSKLLKKVPSHVGILVAEDEFSLKDLANVIVWSVALGISYISVYDINGEIKRNSVVLQRNIEKSKAEVLAQDQSSYDIQLFSTSQPTAETTSSSNQKLHKASVVLLCIEDGHHRIVNIARHISHMVTSGMFRQEDIVPSNVDNFFQESLHFPDPEVCLKFGNTDCLFGYLPWQIRLTEIIGKTYAVRCIWAFEV
ncbi:hypothetical protein EGW08_016557 [Elysia chlorotica]|uniref:ditrans,polycis-polyprenyl diphosphate synthase [(2E,6E)-farnesyldiphosphate specific] n=1 Tax=Elysia chlorotica TaxID=188477 RepID=A0A433T2A8_ELYCH|nr:hypothetical protein EGW08_016557 [Elysia chlorotica]